MGLGLTHPVSSKVLCRKGNNIWRIGAASMHGWRETMEDAHCIHLAMERHPTSGFFGIFDGHSGALCSRYAAEKLPQNIDKVTDLSNEAVLKKVVMETDEDFLTAPEYKTKDDGSAVIFTIGLYDDNTKAYKLINGNVGDSRTVLARKIDGKYHASACTHDHKPTDELERRRIEAAGGTVQMSRVDGQLALSRAFGDRMLKLPMTPDFPPENRKVTSNPDFIVETATSEDFLFMACDGIFEGDVFTRDSAIAWIAEKLAESDDTAVICAKLLDECLHRGSRDNMSAMIIQFKDGTNYHQEKTEYTPGPWFNEENDHKFQEAYIADAKASGYELQDALKLYKEIEAKRLDEYQKKNSST